ncbi:MAG TPA: hypothetical protein VF250_08445 [Conexibacter sp.]
MSRIRKAILPAALLAALATLPAAAHEGDAHYRSVVNEIVPATDGLSATVLDHDDALQLVNASDADVVVLDEAGEPYARLLADGTVQVNARSSMARGENAPPGGAAAEDEHDSADARLYASVTLLAHAGHEHGDEAGDDDGGAAEPRAAWVAVDRTGRYAWHDPRINYRARPVPPQVTDEAKETKVKDWRVPLLVAGQAADVAGTLTWVGEPDAGSSFPTTAVVSLVVLALLAAGAVVLVRRRRGTDEASGA